MEQMDRLYGHDRWMTNLLIDAAAKLPDDKLDQEFDIGHRTLRRTIDHIAVTIEFWTGMMAGQPPTWEPNPTDVATMQARQGATYDRFEALARQLTADGKLDDTFTDHYEIAQSYGGTILHVILHSHMHRSEILHMLQRLGFDDFTEGDPQEWEHFTGKVEPFFEPRIPDPKLA